jgi:DMSO/TMAO reductase YedYZ molybdopterin-dependent catalytic subunit
MNDRLPPNQKEVTRDRWPLVGEKAPSASNEPWTLTISGAIAHPSVWTLRELQSLATDRITVDIHCVTRWSKLGASFTGILLERLIALCQPQETARFISFIARSDRSHSTSLPLKDALDLGTLIALDFEGEPLPTEHGGPVRTVVPRRYFYKSLKWLERIELLNEDRLGYWEADAGYSNIGDPWTEDRYIASNLSASTIQRVLSARDFRGLDLRGLRAESFDLAGLKAENALLRDARFRGANLEWACFDQANLSNAHLQNANLRGASFRYADVEGADFRGADLRGADFTGATFLGATIYAEEDEDASTNGSARIDETTIVDPTLNDDLMLLTQRLGL